MMEIKEQSKKVMISYGFGRASKQFVVMAFNGFGFFFYVAEVGLNIWLGGSLPGFSGLGASAASSVAIARAIAEEFGLSVSNFHS